MSTAPEEAGHVDDGRPEPTGPGGLSAWQKALAILSLLVTIGASAVMGYRAVRSDPAPAAPTAATDATVSTFGGWGNGVERPQPEAKTVSDWTPAIFRLGFSFFAAFCVGYALRSFLKIALVAFGLLFIVLFGLQYFDLIDVDWSRWSGHYDSVIEWLRAQTSGFTEFIQGALPSAGAAALGLVAGFRRRR